MESTNSVSSTPGRLPDTQLDNETQSSLDESYLKLYGFNFNDTYRHALRFYKGNVIYSSLASFAETISS